MSWPVVESDMRLPCGIVGDNVRSRVFIGCRSCDVREGFHCVSVHAIRSSFLA